MSAIYQGAKDRTLILPFITKTLPQVERELTTWHKCALEITNPQLREQALASIAHKRFHCQGGSIFALYTPAASSSLIKLIVALQTISDYLDNLCDRVQDADEPGFRTLHDAMLAAIDIQKPYKNWYRDYPLQNDDGYLDKLIQACRSVLVTLPGYEDIKLTLTNLVNLYCDLQVYKHIAQSQREIKLQTWHHKYKSLAPQTSWWEFAAASGSTLGMFMLVACAAKHRVTAVQTTNFLSAYFPWICGIHILLDYFIDLDEDQEHGDLNFVSYYSSSQEAQTRLSYILANAFKNADILPRAAFHRTVINGLLALYLSDPKAWQSGRNKISRHLLNSGGTTTLSLYKLCLYLRKRGTI